VALDHEQAKERTMNARLGVTLLCASVALSGCANGDASSFGNAAIDNDDQKASYGIGLNIGGQLADASDRLDRAAFMRGLEDAMAGNEPDLSNEELQSVLQAFSQQIQASAADRAAAVGEENAAAGRAYLAENGARAGVTTTASGLQYEVLRAGDGPMPTMDQSARLHYRGTLIDGTEFDSSHDGDPAVFSVGGLIDGFTEALTIMPVGSHYRIVIPSEIGYGPRGSGRAIGPNATLIFEIELIEIVG
jgi:FKBP-type peptidyl-prolyl cis-trans isomerase